MQYLRPHRELVFETPSRGGRRPPSLDDDTTLRMQARLERTASLPAFEVAPAGPLPTRPLDLPPAMRAAIPTPIPWLEAAPPRAERLPIWPIWIVLAAAGLALLFPELQRALFSAVEAFAR